MIIQSVKLRNFKKHQSLDLTFNEKLNLVGGPNEAGKSTIAEAIHAALFFKHNGNSKEQRELQSITTDVGPYVELQFQLGTQVYTLKKTFLRGNSCTLSAAGQQTFAGAAAEEALANLLASEAPLGSPSQAKGEWAHLWVWQGSSGNNPVQALASQQAKMFAQLQDLGVMAAMASEKDQMVAEIFTNKLGQIFTQTGRVRAGSSLFNAQQAFDEAEELYAELSREISSRENKSKEYSQKQNLLIELNENLNSLEIDREESQKKLDELRVLQERLKQEHALLENYQDKETELNAKLDAINSLKKEIQEIEQALQPLTDTIDTLEQRIQDLSETIAQEQGLLSELRKGESSLKEELDFCELEVNILAKNEHLSALVEKLDKINGIGSTLKAYREELGKLPLIEQSDLDKWTKLEGQIHTAKGVLDAIATEVEVLNSEDQISLNGAKVQGKMLLTESSIFQLNGKDLLKITPGGGRSLDDATQEYLRAKGSLEDFKRSLGLQEKLQAVEIVRQREELINQISNESAKLGALEPKEKLQQSKTRAEGELSQLGLQKNELLRLSPQLKDLQGFDFEIHGKEIQQKRNAILLQIQEKSNWVDSSGKSLNELIAKKNEVNQKTSSMRETLSNKKPRLALLEEQAGEELDSLGEIQANKIAQEAVCDQIKLELDAMRPDQITTTYQRIQDVLKTKSEQYRDLELELAGLKGALNETGDKNLYVEQQAAFTKKKFLEDQLAGLRREGEAIQLLNTLFTEEQQVLTRNYVTPFAEKVQHYLRFIFGGTVTVSILSGPSGEFNGLEIYRDQFRDLGAIDFDKLSGGTKEQMAAAVRLAMAEVLAPAYGGHLPMVFDDAFAYSDRDRLEALPDMLYSAAQNGLQIILLSCTPQDYAKLGATEISLSA